VSHLEPVRFPNLSRSVHKNFPQAGDCPNEPTGGVAELFGRWIAEAVEAGLKRK
jgi:hypothetical protein